METKYCQSCGMPLKTAEDFGKNADGSKNEDYCRYCFENGKFTMDCTMDEMIEHCAQFVAEFNKDANVTFTKEQAVAEMRNFFPHLKRWKK